MLAVIGAHPDDAEIGAGGLLVKFGGLAISVLDGVNGTRDFQTAWDEQARAGKMLGVTPMNCRVEHLPGVSSHVVRLLDDIFEVHEVDTVVTHHPGDSNQEHAYTSQAVLAACRRVDNLLYFEPIPPAGRVPFNAQMYLDITEEAEKKYRAMNQYKSQMIRKDRNLIKTRRSLDAWRGQEIGVGLAEAYQVQRWLI